MTLWIFTPEQIREIEQAANDAGYTYDQMMQDAGREIAARAVSMLDGVSGPRVTVLVGKGNNGGDGLVAAARLAEQLAGSQIRLYLLDRRDDDPLMQHALDRGVFAAYAEDDRDGRVAKHVTASADLVIDALFGIGIRLPLRDTAQRTLRHVRQALNERASARRASPSIDPTAPGQVLRPTVRVLAVDCPSGVDTLTGECDAVTLTADETITFIGAKPGLLTGDAVLKAGRVIVAPLDLPDDVKPAKFASGILLGNEYVRGLLPSRSADGHKGTFGRVLVIAGSDRLPGAAGLAALGAYRVGAGLVEVAAPASVARSIQGGILEPIWLPLGDDALDDMLRDSIDAADVVLIGPGLGSSELAAGRTLAVLSYVRESRPDVPLVLDADALNVLAGQGSWANLLPKRAVITPHPGEMARLLRTSTDDVQKDRFAAASQAAEAGVVSVLKGAHTLIAAPNKPVRVSPFKTDALAKAGTGDVLAGAVAGLLAQGLSEIDAASAGVYVHALAGVIAAEQIGEAAGVMASDVARAIPVAIARIKTG
ncbi:MAG: NAD(P)H-hydrate dehydratase [Chloroflexi bacterium]|nr:NAD(P)H-hydrate dehydratase [Chloroflexota bacterium]